jgi:hypothetical protein
LESAHALDKEGQKNRKGSNILGPYITYGLFQTKGEICAKFGSDWVTNANLYKVQTDKSKHNKQTNKKKLSVLYIRFQSIPHKKKNTVSITKAKKLIIFKKR